MIQFYSQPLHIFVVFDASQPFAPIQITIVCIKLPNIGRCGFQYAVVALISYFKDFCMP